MMIRSIGLAALTLLLASCGDGGDDGAPAGDVTQPGNSSSTGTGPTTQQSGIQPMTQVTVGTGTGTGSGYFQDPHPIYQFGDTATAKLPAFSGTTQKVLSCSGAIQPDCFLALTVKVDYTSIISNAMAADSTIHNLENLSIYQDKSGAWQMALVAHLTKAGLNPWNVILHAHPTSAGGGIPTAWTADTLLVGDWGQSAPDDYDPKYFEDNGNLYLIYNKQLSKGYDGIVAQQMDSFTQLSLSPPVPLLGAETADGGYASEKAYTDDSGLAIRITEAANITKINGKYVLTYSVGTFDRPNYKIGVAFSDSFLPDAGTYYKRPQKPDTGGVWGQPNHAEVPYLLQSEVANWPNYIAPKIVAPGVGSIIIDSTGTYYLAFAGYDPSDNPTSAATGRYDGSHRRPYYVKLQVQIPNNSTVSTSSPETLASWIQPVL